MQFVRCRLLICRAYCTNTSASISTTIIPENVKVFNRQKKRFQRNRAALQPDSHIYSYVKDEVGARVADRVYDLVRFNEVCLDLGCGLGHIAPHLIKENVGTLLQCDMSEKMVERSRGAPLGEFHTNRVIADEELIPFRAASADLILSSLAAHWINDLAAWFRRCLNVLRPDGCMIGALFSGVTLYQLRVSLQLAELERLGGVGAHISPFVEPQDIAALMNRAGFTTITVDLDDIEVGYPNMLALMYDLKGMAESNASIKHGASLRREVLIAADAIYREMYATDDGVYPATFQMVSFIGWRPGPGTKKPAKRGSQNVSFKDVGKIVESQSAYWKTPKNS